MSYETDEYGNNEGFPSPLNETTPQILRHQLDLTPEEVQGVRKFFAAMKNGVYLKCDDCGKWSYLSISKVAILTGPALCSPCRASAEASAEASTEASTKPYPQFVAEWVKDQSQARLSDTAVQSAASHVKKFTDAGYMWVDG